MHHPVHGRGVGEDDLGHLLTVGYADGTHLVGRADLWLGQPRATIGAPAKAHVASTTAEPFSVGLLAQLAAANFTCTVSGEDLLVSVKVRGHRDEEVVHRRARYRLDRLMRPPQQHRLVTGVQIVNGGLPGLGKRR